MLEGIALALAIKFTGYPAFIRPGARIEAWTDKGLVVEMIVRCPDGAGIMTFSKVERKFCTPDFYCTRRSRDAIGHLCGSGGAATQ